MQNRIPMEYFLTSGSGESNLSSASNETTSFDAALVDAGIPDVNIMIYSSIIPPKAKEIPQGTNNWGEVMECILSRKDGKRGQTISVGIMIVDIINPMGVHIGGLAIEYSGKDSYTKSKSKVHLMVKEMIHRRNFGVLNGEVTDTGYRVTEKNYLYKSLKIKKKHGTVLVGICFKKALVF
jgi:pyruvoyl-dependent arginine decarboxylase